MTKTAAKWKAQALILKPVRLTGIIRGCNVSNGYPYWIFCYKEEMK